MLAPSFSAVADWWRDAAVGGDAVVGDVPVLGEARQHVPHALMKCVELRVVQHLDHQVVRCVPHEALVCFELPRGRRGLGDNFQLFLDFHMAG